MSSTKQLGFGFYGILAAGLTVVTFRALEVLAFFKLQLPNLSKC